MQLKGDVLNLDAKTTSGQPVQRASASPAYLEVSFPKAKLASSPLSKAVDKGLVQKIQTLQEGDTAILRIYVLSKPKASLTKTQTGYRYSVRMSEPAGSPSATSKPSAAKPPESAKPATPAVTTQPRIVPTTSATASSATTSSATTSSGPAASTREGGGNPKTLISVVFKDEPLARAIESLAGRAGYGAQIDPKLSGVVNLSLSEVPFDEALMMLLQPYGEAVKADIGYTTITVARAESPAAATPAASSGPLVLEYYPFETKDAKKMMDAAMKAIPELSYRVDPVLNILLVQGPRDQVMRLGELLKPMFNK